MSTQNAEYVVLGRNQFDLLTNAIEGLLEQLVEDWQADAPIAKQPWPGRANEVWNAVGQAIGVRGAADKWLVSQEAADHADRLRETWAATTHRRDLLRCEADLRCMEELARHLLWLLGECVEYLPEGSLLDTVKDRLAAGQEGT